MALKGAGASFKLSPDPETPATLTEISTWLNDISGDASTDELDGSTFSPNAVTLNKTILFGATERTYTLSGRWSPTVETFFNDLDGVEDVTYAYGPTGDAAGKTIISGLCNIGAWSGPQQSVDGIIGFTVTLKVTTRTVSVAV